MKNSLYLILLLLLPMLASCVDEYEIKLKEADMNRLVINGHIVSGETCSFTLSYSQGVNAYMGWNDGSSRDWMAVMGEDGSVYNARDIKGDFYSSQARYDVEVGELRDDVRYWLHVKADGQVYESAPLYPTQAPEIDSLTFRQDMEAPGMPVDVFVSTAPTAESVYLRWNYDECWEVYTPYTTSVRYDSFANWVYDIPRSEWTNHGWARNQGTVEEIGKTGEYAGNCIRNKFLYRINQLTSADNRLQTRYRTRVRQYAISKVEYDYLQLRHRQDTEMGGLFTPLPSELPTNITCTTDPERKAVGYIGVSGRPATMEMYIDHSEVTFKRNYTPVYYTDDYMIEEGLVSYFSRSQRYVLLSHYFEDTMDGGKREVSTWTEPWCVDCRQYFWGRASLVKPDDWKDK